MIALNRDEVRRKSVSFWILFALLLFSTLIVVYFFVWTAQRENSSYMARLDELRRIENKQTIYLSGVKNLYGQMDRVSSMTYLSAYDKIEIANYAKGIKNQIGPDSSTSFSGYYSLLKNHPVQMEILDTLLTAIEEKARLKDKLDRCRTIKIRKGNPFLDRNR